MRTHRSSWDITHMQNGYVRTECWTDGCDWHLDFEAHVPRSQLQDLIVHHVRRAHGKQITRHNVRAAMDE